MVSKGKLSASILAIETLHGKIHFKAFWFPLSPSIQVRRERLEEKQKGILILAFMVHSEGTEMPQQWACNKEPEQGEKHWFWNVHHPQEHVLWVPSLYHHCPTQVIIHKSRKAKPDCILVTLHCTALQTVLKNPQRKEPLQQLVSSLLCWALKLSIPCFWQFHSGFKNTEINHGNSKIQMCRSKTPKIEEVF